MRTTDTQRRSLQRNVMLFLGLLFAAALAGAVGGSEMFHPGYGIVSRQISSPASIAAARGLDEERGNQQAIVDDLRIFHGAAFCPNPKRWPGTKPQDQRRWHAYWRAQGYTLLADSQICYSH